MWSLRAETLSSRLAGENFLSYLVSDRSNVFERQRLELVLFEEIIQVLLKHLKYQTCVVFVLEAFICSHKVVVISTLLGQPRQDAHLQAKDSHVKI